MGLAFNCPFCGEPPCPEHLSSWDNGFPHPGDKSRHSHRIAYRFNCGHRLTFIIEQFADYTAVYVEKEEK